MTRLAQKILGVTLGVALLAACGGAEDQPQWGNSAKGENGESAQFAQFTEADFDAWLDSVKQEAANAPVSGGPFDMPLYTMEATASPSTKSITNNQEAGVDEGDIVKAHGNHLVVLRRGRLFTVSMAGDTVAPVSYIDARPAGANHHSWYDEMLVSGDTVVVVGYSYSVRATEIGLFSIDDAGNLAHRDSYFLRSNDYYSSRNYASRLVDGKLVFYMPYGLLLRPFGTTEYQISLPAMRPWRNDDWTEIVNKTTIYKPVQKVAWPVLHTIVTCDMNAATFGCEAQGIIGPFSRNFYVSKDAVYLWVSGTTYQLHYEPVSAASTEAVVYRMPLDGSSPGAVVATGTPADQFSFKETSGALNVVVRSRGGGDWMWSPEVTAGDTALVTIPLADFSSMVKPLEASRGKVLTNPGQGYIFHNRFVGDHLLYGTGNGWWDAASDGKVYVYNYKTGGDVTELVLGHGIDRIEPMGKRALVVGSLRVQNGEEETRTDLHLAAIQLTSDVPKIAATKVELNAMQGENRSHGFFYNQSTRTFGLPIRSEGAGYSSLFSGSASVMFFKSNNFSFTKLGELGAQVESANDACVVSCTDWYGNARPIFYDGRIFALLGYELVEGQIASNVMTETARTDFSSVIPQ